VFRTGQNPPTVAVDRGGTVGGDDRLAGDLGAEALFGGPANDSLDGGAHTDRCDGEAGSDAFLKCETMLSSPTDPFTRHSNTKAKTDRAPEMPRYAALPGDGSGG
jgi:Ca2+-binding RTX toxin-like protein